MHGRTPPLECGNCEYWLSRHVAAGLSQEAAAQAHERALAIGSPIAEGRCHRYPQPVPKQRGESCGDHSELEAQRRAELAAQIARLLAAAIGAEPEPPIIEPSIAPGAGQEGEI